VIENLAGRGIHMTRWHVTMPDQTGRMFRAHFADAA